MLFLPILKSLLTFNLIVTAAAGIVVGLLLVVYTSSIAYFEMDDSLAGFNSKEG